MKKILLLLAFLATPALSQQYVFCNAGSSTICNTSSNPGSGVQGDPAWKAFGKLNSDISILWSTQTFTGTGAYVLANGPTVDLSNAFNVPTNQLKPGALPAGVLSPGGSTIDGISDAQTLTNKVINANNNTITNVAAATVKGFLNVCNYSVSGFCGDTLRNFESVTCTSTGGGTATIVGISENLSTSPYASGNAHGVVGGCGPIAAQNVRGGITTGGAPVGYAVGDFVTPSGGTPSYTVTLSGSIAVTTGVLTVTGTPTLASGTAPNSGGGLIQLGQVLSGGGTGAVIFITNFISGTGGAGTYQTNSVVASTPTTATPTAVYEVMQTSTFAVAVVSAGSYSVQPGTAQGATNGGGSGATFSPPFTGLPLEGTVTAVANGSFTINVVCVTCGAVGNNWWAVGHDDAPAINAAIAAGTSGIYLPATITPAYASILTPQFSQFSQIQVPNNREFIFACLGNSLNALGALNAQLLIPYNPGVGLFFIPSNNSVTDCYLEGWNAANYNIYHSAANWRLESNMLRDAIVKNLEVGDSAGDNAENNSILSNTFHNDLSVTPAGAGYGFATSSGSSDNQIVNMYGDGCIWACAQFNSAGTSMGFSHLYLAFGGPTFDIEGAKTYLTNVISDNSPPGTAAYFVNAGIATINSWQANTTNATNGQIGVLLNVDSNISIGCGTVGAVSGNWNGNTSNIVLQSASFTTNRIAPCIIKQDQPMYAASFGIPNAGGAQNINAPAAQTLSLGNVTHGLMVNMPDCAGAACVNALQLQAGKEGAQAVIITKTTGTSQADQAINLTAANAPASSAVNGGAASVNGGNADANTAASIGGTANLTGGIGSANASATGIGGSANVKGGAGGANNTAGGAVNIAGGVGNGSGATGAVNIQTSATSGVTNVNTNTSNTSPVNIANGASNSGAVHVADTTGGTGNVFVGNTSDTVTISGGFVSMNGTKRIECGTSPTLGAGFGTASISPAFACSDAFAVVITAGVPTVTLALTGFSALPATHFWDCQIYDQSSSTKVGYTSGSSTTSATVTMNVAPANTDTLVVHCAGI